MLGFLWHSQIMIYLDLLGTGMHLFLISFVEICKWTDPGCWLYLLGDDILLLSSLLVVAGHILYDDFILCIYYE